MLAVESVTYNIYTYGTCSYDSAAHPGRVRRLLALLQIRRVFRPHLIPALAMMIALFLLALATFGYLVYVLLKPEKF